MELLFFVLFLAFAGFLLLIGWGAKNAVALAFAGVAFCILAVQLGAGVTYVCGLNTTIMDNHTFQNFTAPTAYNTNSTSFENAQNYYCNWNFKTDAASGVTSNAGFTVMFGVLGVYLFLAAALGLAGRKGS